MKFKLGICRGHPSLAVSDNLGPSLSHKNSGMLDGTTPLEVFSDSWKQHSVRGGTFKREVSIYDSLIERSPPLLETLEEDLVSNPPPLETLEEDIVSELLDVSWKQRSDLGKTFKREALDRSSLIVMSTPSGRNKPWEANLEPGTYCLAHLALFPDIGKPIPRHARICVERSNWRPAVAGSDDSSGTFIVDADALATVVPVEFATSILLDFYGCTLIGHDSLQEIKMTDKHVIQDFTYSMDYFEQYANKNSGFEIHDFAHIDCPLDNLEGSGTFIIGKWNKDGDVLLLTAFRVPQMHTLYIPGGVVHSNDYLLGTWRTMLSWTSEKPIDHVKLMSTSCKSSLGFTSTSAVKAALNIETYSRN